MARNDSGLMRNSALALTGGAVMLLTWRAALRWSREVSFRGQVVVITGGSRGLGLALARRFGRLGARLAICSRTESQLEAAAEELRERGVDVLAQRCDVTQRDQVDAFFQAVRERFGRVDVLINNAGIIQVGPLATMETEDYDMSLATHLYGPLHCVDAVLPEMKRRQSGRIVNVASIGGEIAVPHLSAYCVGKFALVGFSRSLRAELAGTGIHVTTVSPGLMRTGSARNAFFKGQHRQEYAWFSIGSSLPGITVSADHAARQIIDACAHGDAELQISLPAKLAIRLVRFFPELSSEIRGLANRLLPAAGGVGSQNVRGYQSTSSWSPSPLTTLGDQAARENNEL